MEMTAAIQYILTAAQSLGSQDHYKKVSSDDTWACWCIIILRKREATDKIGYRMFRRKYLGKLGEVSKQQ